MIHSGAMTWVQLHPGRERSVLRRHPWVLSGAVARSAPELAPGDLVEVRSAQGEPLASGDWSPRSQIRVRILRMGKEPADAAFVATRLRAALGWRGGHPALADTDASRLVNVEGDGLPGPVVDRYAAQLVVRVSTAGMLRRLPEIARELETASGAEGALSRPDPAAARREGFDAAPDTLWGAAASEPVGIREGARRYAVDLNEGQKTGFYLDARDARRLVEAHAAGARVLDLFAYTGGFSVAAAQGGARSVTSVDSSAPALALAARNLAPCRDRVALRSERADAFAFARADSDECDLLVVDPPPLARRRGEVPRASRAYKDVLLHTLRRAAPGAQLFVFSCSHHVGADLFRKLVFGASLDAGRSLQVLAELGAPPDHPEGRYFSGLWLQA